LLYILTVGIAPFAQTGWTDPNTPLREIGAALLFS